MSESNEEQAPLFEGPQPPLLELPPIIESTIVPVTVRPAPETPRFSGAYILGCAGLALVYVVMIIAGGTVREFAIAGLEAIPFAILAMLAYEAGSANSWKCLAVAYWIVIVLALCLIAWLFTIAALIVPAPASGMPLSRLQMGVRIGGSLLALVLAFIAGLACYLPKIRRAAARVVGLDPESFVHATALATAVALALIFVIPLLTVSEPPMLTLIRGGTLLNRDGSDGQLRATLYTLVWSVPAAFFAVGFPRRRSFSQARERLALVRPTLLQVAAAIGTVGFLLVFMHYFDVGVAKMWEACGWPMTDSGAIMALFKFGAGPWAAVLVGIAAGLGEELVFRGVLQPRLGVLLPALMFTSVHAFQYNFDAILQVLILGVTFGLIRKRTNTTTCALIHGGYDCVVLLWMYLAGGGNG